MSREKFEAWWEINYHNGNPPRFGWAAWRDGDGYKIDDDESELDGMWNAWQAATNAMEAKCAALAAENAALKQSELEYDATCREEFGADWVTELTETPATDAFLAEVRASAVDEAGLKISNAIVNCYQDEQIGLDAAATICGDFAAQLRQGGAV